MGGFTTCWSSALRQCYAFVTWQLLGKKGSRGVLADFTGVVRDYGRRDEGSDAMQMNPIMSINAGFKSQRTRKAHEKHQLTMQEGAVGCYKNKFR